MSGEMSLAGRFGKVEIAYCKSLMICGRTQENMVPQFIEQVIQPKSIVAGFHRLVIQCKPLRYSMFGMILAKVATVVSVSIMLVKEE